MKVSVGTALCIGIAVSAMGAAAPAQAQTFDPASFYFYRLFQTQPPSAPPQRVASVRAPVPVPAYTRAPSPPSSWQPPVAGSCSSLACAGYIVLGVGF